MNPRDKTTPRVRGSMPQTEQAARDLRKRSTPAEEALWSALRNRRLNGLRFRRQHPIGPFVADFYCAEARLVIELDGAAHDDADQAIHDAARTEQLERYGYRVVRFRNELVLMQLDRVLEAIAEAVADAGHKPQ